jgi:hypothetical protein
MGSGLVRYIEMKVHQEFAQVVEDGMVRDEDRDRGDRGDRTPLCMNSIPAASVELLHRAGTGRSRRPGHGKHVRQVLGSRRLGGHWLHQA